MVYNQGGIREYMKLIGEMKEDIISQDKYKNEAK
jgi:hypothetical protein